MSQSHSAEKLERGDPLETKKILKKVAQCRKISNPIVSSCFVSYDKNGVTERGDPLHYPKFAPRLPLPVQGPVV